MKITFLGAGVFGSALANIAKDNGHEVKFYDPFKYPDINLHDATNGSDLNIFTAPSSANSNILPELDKDTPLIIASKGFVSLRPFQNFKNVTALGGAGFADELNHTTFTTSSETAENIFSTENIKLEYTDDTLGIMLCGALKNIYALGAGLYGEADSTAAPMSYLETAISEMRQILEANHANPNTLRLSCGAADLVLSCTEKSRNFRFGRELKTTIPEKLTIPKSSTSQNTTKTVETIESIAIINSLDNYPEFIISESANLINDIINTIKEYYATQ